MPIQKRLVALFRCGMWMWQQRQQQSSCNYIDKSHQQRVGMTLNLNNHYIGDVGCLVSEGLKMQVTLTVFQLEHVAVGNANWCNLFFLLQSTAWRRNVLSEPSSFSRHSAEKLFQSLSLGLSNWQTVTAHRRVRLWDEGFALAAWNVAFSFWSTLMTSFFDDGWGFSISRVPLKTWKKAAWGAGHPLSSRC